MSLPVADPAALLRALVDIPSVSGGEARIADAVELALRGAPHLDVGRDGNTVWARSALDRSSRVIIAGHLDTVPVAGLLPSRPMTGPDGTPWLLGRGAVDMKGGVAVMVHLATTLVAPVRDVTWLFYDCEEIEAERNGLGHLAAARPELLRGDLAILMEPTDGVVEGGCQGSMRFTVTTRGKAAHSARPWQGDNAVHKMAAVLDALLESQSAFAPEVVDGLTYREALNATVIEGGTAGNVIPDRCVAQLNYRFAPSTSAQQAEDRMRGLFGDLGEMHVLDLSPGARPGLDQPAVASFVAAVGGEPRPKFGWTDVARFAALGVPALNYGPGDPAGAHSDHEAVSLAQVGGCADSLRRFLGGA